MVILSDDLQELVGSKQEKSNENRKDDDIITNTQKLIYPDISNNIDAFPINNNKYEYEINRSPMYNFKIIYDSNDKINSGEGVMGFSSLFKSRYDKSLRILASRSDSKRIKKIETVKQIFNQTKIKSNSESLNRLKYLKDLKRFKADIKQIFLALLNIRQNPDKFTIILIMLYNLS